MQNEWMAISLSNPNVFDKHRLTALNATPAVFQSSIQQTQDTGGFFNATQNKAGRTQLT
jgi:hypothetical protein